MNSTYKQEGNSKLDCVPRTAVVAMSDGGWGSGESQICPPGVPLGWGTGFELCPPLGGGEKGGGSVSQNFPNISQTLSLQLNRSLITCVRNRKALGCIS